MFKLYFFSLALIIFTQSAHSEDILLRKVIRLKNRFMIHSFISEQFGPAGREISKEIVLKQGTVFSGPCSIYEQSYIKKNELIDEELKCFSGLHERLLPIYGKTNTLRSALTLKLCAELVKCDECLDYAVNKDSINVPLFSFNQSDKVSVIKLFMKDRQVPLVTMELIDKHSNSILPRTHFNKYFYLTCLLPGWQVLY